MASSNKHWPSMFKKSKPSNPHGINSSLMSTAFQRSPYASGGDERSPEPKPRWNPKPEQIRILEAIFNSGMVNPPRDEIRKIRTQLQEYGQVGDANVFYWFQNRKSRSKHKLRHLQNKNKINNSEAQQQTSSSLPQITAAPNSSSSSSSDKSSPPNKEIIIPHKGFSTLGMMPTSPTASVNNQTYFLTQNETNNFQALPLSAEPFSFPMQHNGQGMVANNAITTQGFYLSEFSNMIQMLPQTQPQQNAVPFNSMLLSEIMSYGGSSKKDEIQDKDLNIMLHNQDPQLSFCLTSTSTDPTPVPPLTDPPLTTVPSPITQLQVTGVGEEEADGSGTGGKCTVFINDVAFEVEVGPFNVREAFGDGAVLFHSSGHPVLTDEWGVTLQSLQHGASYYYLI